MTELDPTLIHNEIDPHRPMTKSQRAIAAGRRIIDSRAPLRIASKEAGIAYSYVWRAVRLLKLAPAHAALVESGKLSIYKAMLEAGLEHRVSAADMRTNGERYESRDPSGEAIRALESMEFAVTHVDRILDMISDYGDLPKRLRAVRGKISRIINLMEGTCQTEKK